MNTTEEKFRKACELLDISLDADCDLRFFTPSIVFTLLADHQTLDDKKQREASEILAECIKTDPEFPSAYVLLVHICAPREITETLGLTTFKDDVAKVLDKNEKYPALYRALAYMMEEKGETAAVFGTHMTLLEVLVKGVEIDPDPYPMAFCSLKRELSGQGVKSVVVNGETFDKKALKVKFWECIGMHLEEGQEVPFGDEKMTREACLKNAADLKG
eukprot:TRINITY_DN57333_c0_g3_i1.p2 TRINITY_DN57333_c0_g3~~TRINITY_DN57333_c0_g3_i1.p2  ORF type:complete len:217 (-),score=37.28 TRINITY_DN57333_c0_g3_i1:1335-1985(-)